jgi:hypothetical protein
LPRYGNVPLPPAAINIVKEIANGRFVLQRDCLSLLDLLKAFFDGFPDFLSIARLKLVKEAHCDENHIIGRRKLLAVDIWPDEVFDFGG